MSIGNRVLRCRWVRNHAWTLHGAGTRIETRRGGIGRVSAISPSWLGSVSGKSLKWLGDQETLQNMQVNTRTSKNAHAKVLPFNPAAFSPFVPNPLPRLSSWRPKPKALVFSSTSTGRASCRFELSLNKFDTKEGGAEVKTGRTS